MRPKRTNYHHGDLRTALIGAADAIIAEGGIEAFSLRAAAQRAGVSPGAPAHHFGSARGLLTEVALLAYERMEQYLEKAGRRDDLVADVRALSLAFVTFAVENPGHFRLMFRHDLVDRTDPRYSEVSRGSSQRVGMALAAYRGERAVDVNSFADMADLLCGMATLHGLASLVLEEKAPRFFRGADAQSFVEDVLPRVLERLYPERTVVD